MACWLLIAGATPAGAWARASAQPVSGLDAVAHQLGVAPVGLVLAGNPGALTRVDAPPGQAFPRAAGVSPRTAATIAARSFLLQHLGTFTTAISAAATGVAHTLATESGQLVTFAQQLDGVPVLGGSVTVSLTSDNRVRSVAGHLSGASVAVRPVVTTSAVSAATDARAAAAAAEDVPVATLVSAVPALTYYDPATVGVPVAAPARMVWDVLVTSRTRSDLRQRVFVDEVGGLVAFQYSDVQAIKARVVCDDQDKVVDYQCPSQGSPVVASEATPPAGAADPDVAAAYANVGGVYDFYRDVLGRDGIDGHGGAMAATVHVCEDATACPMVDSFWDGQGVIFGDGFPEADDVVAHEMTHGVTQYTSGLFYFYQSGAIDESMSDVMGELYDQWNGTGRDSDGTNGTIDYRWMIGEDLPASVGVLRDMRDPTTPPVGVATPNFTPQPDSMTSPLYRVAIDPASGAPEDNGAVHLDNGVGNKTAELIVDGGTLNGVTVSGFGGANAGTRMAAIVKAAHLYYLTDESLPSGASYADLAATLTQACSELTGKPLADGRGGAVSIDRGDCASVREAAAATRLTTDPKRVSAPVAPTCSAGIAQSFGFRDNFENTSTRLWKTGAGWYDPQTRAPGTADLSYASSGHNELYASDGATARDSSATMLKTYPVPIGKVSYLRFHQAYLLDYQPAGNGAPGLFFDGGRVEYSRNGGAWTSAAKLFDFGGYTDTVTGYTGDKEVYSFRGYGGDSHGYRSARIALSSLAGSTVRFRFRLTSDSFGSSYGWFIDDVDFYACGASPSAVKASVSRGAGTTRLSWAAPTDHGTSPISRYLVSVADMTTGHTVDSSRLAASTRSLAVAALTGHRYRITIAAYNASGRGASTALAA